MMRAQATCACRMQVRALCACRGTCAWPPAPRAAPPHKLRLKPRCRALVPQCPFPALSWWSSRSCHHKAAGDGLSVLLHAAAAATQTATPALNLLLQMARFARLSCRNLFHRTLLSFRSMLPARPVTATLSCSGRSTCEPFDAFPITTTPRRSTLR